MISKGFALNCKIVIRGTPFLRGSSAARLWSEILALDSGLPDCWITFTPRQHVAMIHLWCMIKIPW